MSPVQTQRRRSDLKIIRNTETRLSTGSSLIQPSIATATNVAIEGIFIFSVNRAVYQLQGAKPDTAAQGRRCGGEPLPAPTKAT